MNKESTSARQSERAFFVPSDGYHAVSLSGGKDSTAMLLLMIERNMPIDAVLHADTGMEFPEMEDHISKVDDYLFRERRLHVTRLRHTRTFEQLMFDDPKVKASSIQNRIALGMPICGNGWPGIRVRWCTGQLKEHVLNRKVKELRKGHPAFQYIGIAADESRRCKAEIYPLVDWGITEAEALQICYNRGFDFGGLYRIYRRASCWCCPFQRIDELRKMRIHHPALWKRLLDMDERAIKQFGYTPLGQFKKGWTVAALDDRFHQEECSKTASPEDWEG